MQMRRTWRTGVFWPCLSLSCLVFFVVSCLFCPAVFVCPVCLFVLSLCVCVVLSVLLFVFVCLRSRCVLRLFGPCLSVLSCLSCFLYDLMSCAVSCVFFLICLIFFLVLQILVARRWNGHADATYRWNRHTDAILAGHASGYLLVTLVLAYLLTGRACWSCWCLVAGCAF